jgi:very-short-patch-repair endonuclease
MERLKKEINQLQKRNKEYLDKLRKKATKAEVEFKKILDELNVYYIFQKGFFGDRYHCIVDFYLPKPKKLCIEIDGEYHLKKDQIIKDERKRKFLVGVRGFKLLRFKNN